MKQLPKKKTSTKKKTDNGVATFNGTLIGTWKNSDIIRITFDSGAVIVKYGNDEYKPSKQELRELKANVIEMASHFNIKKDKVVIINV